MRPVLDSFISINTPETLFVEALLMTLKNCLKRYETNDRRSAERTPPATDMLGKETRLTLERNNCLFLGLAYGII